MTDLTGQRFGFDDFSNGNAGGVSQRRNDRVSSIERLRTRARYNPDIVTSTVGHPPMLKSLNLPQQQTTDAVEPPNVLARDTFLADDGLDFEFLLQNVFSAGLPTSLGNVDMNVEVDTSRF